MPQGSGQDAGPAATAPTHSSVSPAVAARESATPGPSAALNGSPLGPVPPLTYVRYVNARFAFSIDAPAFFHAEPPPTNGDGQEWTWGGHATMMASGMNNPSLRIADLCKDAPSDRKGVKARRMSKATCWVTGLDAGKIYWEKTVLSGPFLFSLRLEYDEALKAAFDPIVAHVNASWHYRTCEADRIDACGLCYQRCRTTADCKGEGDICQPVRCGPDMAGVDPVFGRGCMNPDDEFSLRPGTFPMDDSSSDP
jgi:hypothetical protein